MNYNKKWWCAIRSAVLRRDEYICQECKRFGKNAEACVVHHVLPAVQCVGKYEALKRDSRNLISLCKKCHEKMHIRNSGELSSAGKNLLRRKKIHEIKLL